MKISSLTNEQIKELVRRWHYRHYSKSSFRASPIAFEKLVNDDVAYALKNRKARAAGTTLVEMIGEQIGFERQHNLSYYDEYKTNLI